MNNKAENHDKCIHPYLPQETALDFKLGQDSKIFLRNELYSYPYKYKFWGWASFKYSKTEHPVNLKHGYCTSVSEKTCKILLVDLQIH